MFEPTVAQWWLVILYRATSTCTRNNADCKARMKKPRQNIIKNICIFANCWNTSVIISFDADEVADDDENNDADNKVISLGWSCPSPECHGWPYSAPPSPWKCANFKTQIIKGHHNSPIFPCPASSASARCWCWCWWSSQGCTSPSSCSLAFSCSSFPIISTWI